MLSGPKHLSRIFYIFHALLVKYIILYLMVIYLALYFVLNVEYSRDFCVMEM